MLSTLEKKKQIDAILNQYRGMYEIPKAEYFKKTLSGISEAVSYTGIYMEYKPEIILCTDKVNFATGFCRSICHDKVAGNNLRYKRV